MSIEQAPVPPPGDGGLLRLRLDLAYDGAPFSGWAVQPGRRTAQGVLEEALALILRREVRVVVAGRTDAGVHARGQVVHFDLSGDEWRGLCRGAEGDPALALLRRLRGTLSRVLGDERGSLAVFAAALAPGGFDARFSALWRRYSYRIADAPRLWDPVLRGVTLWHREELDVEVMNAAGAQLLGLRDFLAFCKPREGATTVRELQRIDFTRASDGVILAEVKADAFCHNMVRALVGAALRVGEGSESPAWLHERLLARVRDEKTKLAPPHPLVLEEVGYPEDEAGLAARAEQARAVRDGV